MPLNWPMSRPRKATRKSAAFGSKGRTGYMESLTIGEAMERLQREVDLLGARDLQLTSNLQLNLNGSPKSQQANPSDPGIALYFTLKGKPHCMPCDTYTRAADNIAAIAKHIEATRAIDRFGVATVEEMFTGFQALPAPGTRRPWREVLGIEGNPTRGQIEAYWRNKARTAHPDRGGSDALMAEINAARDEALREIPR